MKKKKIIILIIIAIAVIILIAAICALCYFAPMLSMKPAETGKIEATDIISVANKNNNIYVIGTDDGYILIDAGSDGNTLVNSLKELSIGQEEVNNIFLTHTDYDHVAALSYFENANVYISKDEKQMIDGTTRRSSAGGNSLPSNVKERLTLLENNEKLEIGGHTVECINAAGHTPGSMIFLIDDKYLFTGDAFAVSVGVVSVHPYTMDNETAKKTINELQPVINKSELVFTAHYGYFKSDTIVIP